MEKQTLLARAHPERLALHNEVHARPYDALLAPSSMLHWVYSTVDCDAADVVAHLGGLMKAHHLPAPDAHSSQIIVDLPSYRLRWERHAEFVTYTVWQASVGAHSLSAILPAAWLQGAVGQLMCAVAVDIHRGTPILSAHRCSVQAVVAEGGVTLQTDYQVMGNGFSQWQAWVHDTEVTSSQQIGRVVQQVLEIETYRKMGLLGLPAARAVSLQLKQLELDLVAISVAIDTAQKSQEPALLEKLTRLASQVESLFATHHARFSATSAYMDLVQQRLNSLNEQPIGDYATMASFLSRRLTPAAQTCAWAARRLQAMSERVSRNSQLLRTRVEIEQQEHHKALLSTMTERQLSQLRLQQTVEGLSAVAIAYYAAGIVGYLSKALLPYGWWFSVELTTALSIPIVFLLVVFGLHRVKQNMPR